MYSHSDPPRWGWVGCRMWPSRTKVKEQVSRPPMSSSDWDLTFTWRSPDIHPTFTWHSPNHLTIIWPSPDPHHTLTQPWLGDFKLHLTFTWHSLMFTWCSPDNLTIIWPSPDPYLTIISSIQLKKKFSGGGWVGGWINPLQTLSQGLVLALRFTFELELDKRFIKLFVPSGQMTVIMSRCWAVLRAWRPG